MAGRAKKLAKRESKTFSSSAWHLFFVQHPLQDNLFQSQQQNASLSPIQLCLTQSRPLTLFLLELFAGVCYQEDPSNEWSCSFSFHLTSPNFRPSVMVGTNNPSHLNHGINGLDP